MSARWQQALAVKEARGLAPVWLAVVAATAGVQLAGVRPLQGIGVFAYSAGCAAIGALAVGHEYGGRTLASLLTQPASRSRVFAIKLAVAGVLLATLAPLGLLVFGDIGGRNEELKLFAALGPVAALCVGPWLTMLCRNTLAGAVFTIGIPGSMLMAINVAYFLAYRVEAPQALVLSLVWWGTLAVCAGGAVLGWRTFVRLEAIDGPGAELMSPTWMPGVAGVARPRHPLRALVEKEIGLQGLPLTLSALYATGWIATLVLRSWSNRAEAMFGVLTVLHCLALPVLMGVLASAEERHLGTLEWQATLPLRTSTQWAVKTTTLVVLAWLLATLMPWAMLSALDPLFARAISKGPEVPLLQAAMAVAALYVSSLSPNGVRALAQAGAMAVVLSIPMAAAFRWIAERSQRVWAIRRNTLWWWEWLGFDSTGRLAAIRTLEVVLVILVLAPLVRAGLENHRSADPASGRPLAQMAVAMAWLSAGALVFLALSLYA